MSQSPAPTSSLLRRLISRLNFLRASGLIVGASFAAPFFLCAQSPSQELNLALIGVGGKGAANLEGLSPEDVAAICDVDAGSSGKAAAKQPRARQYRDFRTMLEQIDIEAVLVTPSSQNRPTRKGCEHV